MAQRANSALLMLLFCSLALPAWGQQYYLYEPKPLASEEESQNKDGILVKEVPIKDGDTLSGISRKFSGRGTYYPQILLFNKIKNPNLIYSGSTLKVPITKDGTSNASGLPRKKSVVKSGKLNDKKIDGPQTNVSVPTQHPAIGAPGAASTTELSANDLKVPNEEKVSKRLKRGKSAGKGRVRNGKEKGVVSDKTGAGRNPVGADANQKLFERAVKAYRQDDFSTALSLFDKYLEDTSNSPLAADASLYKAECYLKLSSQ